MDVSVVIPFYNEEGNVEFVLGEISEVLRREGRKFEVIAVDDCSRDGTAELLKKVSAVMPELRIITHPHNYGQAAALFTAFEAATGDVLITLDGDRQNDFRDVPRLLPLLEQYDAVFGQRVNRQDPPSKLVASRIGNSVRRFFLRDGVRDTACGLKLMKRTALKYILPVDGFQRFIPFLLKEAGMSFIAVDVNHRHRSAGKSKFSLLKLYFIGPIMDLFCMCWYQRRNLYRIRRKTG